MLLLSWNAFVYGITKDFGGNFLFLDVLDIAYDWGLRLRTWSVEAAGLV